MLTLSSPSHLRHSPLRRAVAMLVLAAYALPLSVGALSELSHRAFHLMERLEEHRARAAAMGLVHLADQGRERPAFVHTHDGSTHAHAAPVDALLSASEHADDEQDVAPPVVKLSAHAPAAGTHAWLAQAVIRAFAALDVAVPDHPRPLPPLPPPRG